ncbi:MAG TPA: DUF2877 domain-containing protein [Ktedonobacterales bacterium]|nr:DUF2877 domain-containing protein [Ktedonobacterales bacterium]
MATLSLLVLSHSTAIVPMLDLPTTRGSIHSVFPRAANLLLGGRLLTLHARETPCAPNGLVLALRANQKPLAGLQPGMVCLVERGVITIPAANLRLDPQQSQPWNPRPQLASGVCPPKRVQENLGLLETYLSAHASTDGLAGLACLQPEASPEKARASSRLLTTARLATQNLLDGIAQQRMSLARQGVSALIGLGPGLTPSGDDVLTGLIAATLVLGEALEQPVMFYQRLSAEALALAYSRTNKISSTWIEYAGRGEVAEHLGRLFEALTQHDRSLIEQAAQEVLSSGATSGGDLLAGIILGGRCLIAQATQEGSVNAYDIHGQ